MNLNLVSKVEKTMDINPYVTLRLVQLPKQKQGDQMNPSYANLLRQTIEKTGILPYGDIPVFVSFIYAKRSFLVKTNTAKFFLLTPFLKGNTSWIYEVRRNLGQDHCCARAHATGQGLPGIKLERTYPDIHNAFMNRNMLPCQKHFLDNMDAPYDYISKTANKNKIRLDENEITDTVKISYRVLIKLISGEAPFSSKLDEEEAKEISMAEMKQIRLTQLGDIAGIVRDARLIVEEAESREAANTDDVDLSTLKAVRFTVTGSICALEEIKVNLENTKDSELSIVRLYKSMEVIKVVQRQVQSIQFSMLAI